MDGATIQARIYAGYGKAAQRLGLSCDVYRPLTMAAPLGNKVATLKAAFDSKPNYSFSAPNEYGDATWYGVFDGSLTQPGDYLVGPGGAFFIAAQQLQLPILCVECNRQVRITRMPATAGVGAVGYSGLSAAASVDVIGQVGAAGAFGTGWPASILFKGRSEMTGTGLPSATKNVGWQILLPPSATAQINAGDFAIDDLGRRYAIQGSELTDLGWRIQAVEEHA